MTTTTEKSYIVARDGKCQTFVGTAAVDYVRAEALAASLKLYAEHKITMGMTVTQMLIFAEEYTGRKYKRTQVGDAAAEVRAYAHTLKSSLPVHHA